MNEPAIESAINLCRAMGNDKAADEIAKLRSKLEEAKRERAALIEENNNLRSHRNEALDDAREFAEQVSKLTERLDAQAELAELKRGEPVAFTNSWQLEHCKNPEIQKSLMPLAMWGRIDNGVDIPLYTAPPTANQIRAQAFEEAANVLDDGWPATRSPSFVLREEAKKLREL